MYAAYNVITAPKRLMLAYDKGHPAFAEATADHRSVGGCGQADRVKVRGQKTEDQSSEEFFGNFLVS